MSLLSLAFLTTAAFAIATTPTQCNIHVKLPAAPTSNITDTQKQLSLLFSNPSDQALDFTSVNDPHVTLFLTTFTDINSPDFISAAEVSLKQAYATSCAPTTYINIAISQYASGSYGMLDVGLTTCLQALSDSLVTATSKYVDPSAKEYIPDWVYQLPPEEQKAKIDLISQYGSPNVLSGFSPHVTLLADDVNTTELAGIMAANTVPEVEGLVTLVGFGNVGSFGSVLKGQDLLPPLDVTADEK
ncbi:hypothetical protein TrST_g6413 [Triparma strigata]|uniref:Uncharacterized protein n=1 Tax=Triparma strigata TaxID=1606541 RepID=A0A9W7BSL4_9STRA|nr:hypothetical protein TrST_g6413 [Triparma strigata]